MLLYPAHAAEALEFTKVAQLLKSKCRTDAARERVDNLRFHTRLEYVEKALLQTREYKSILMSGDYFPNDFTQNIEKELKLLAIAGAVLDGNQLLDLQKLSLCIRDILNWFRNHEGLFTNLSSITEKISYEKEIAQTINAVIDETGHVRDYASRELMSIRSELSGTRQELRKLFESVLL